MEDAIEELQKKFMESLTAKSSDWRENVYSSQQYQQEVKALQVISMDFVNTIRTISIYSKRGGDIYNNFLCIRTIDDLIQSAIGIKTMVENGIHNTVRRELRYLIEMTSKYVLIDYAKMGESFDSKTEYLRDNVPNSSIEIIEDYSTPFSGTLQKQFRSEIKDFFIKLVLTFIHRKNKLTNKWKIMKGIILSDLNHPKCLRK